MPTIHISGGPPKRGSGLFVFLPGVTLVALGVLILVLPELLRYLVAGFFVAIGVVLLAAATQMRQGGIATRWLNSIQDRYRGS